MISPGSQFKSTLRKVLFATDFSPAPKQPCDMALACPAVMTPHCIR